MHACVCACARACVSVEMCAGMYIRMRAPARLCSRFWMNTKCCLLCRRHCCACNCECEHRCERRQACPCTQSLSLHTRTHALTRVHTQQRHLSTCMVMDYIVMARQQHELTYMVMDYTVMARQRHVSTSQKIKLIYTSMMVQRNSNSYHCLKLKCKSDAITT